MVHYILQPHHIFIYIKDFIFMLVPSGLQLLIISMCFAQCMVMGINKSHVLTAGAHEIAILIHGFLFIDICLLISCDTGIYAIICVNYLSAKGQRGEGKVWSQVYFCKCQ